jgi:Transposase
VRKPQVIDDEEYERVFEKVAAVDVAKKDGMVCLRGPHASRPGGRQSTVWTVPATMNAVAALGDQLAEAGVQKVTLESASDYWRIWFYVLEAAGLDVQLVSASQVRQLSGRPKTGRLDAMWLARLTGKGLLRPSFVPPAQIRALRQPRTRHGKGQGNSYLRGYLGQAATGAAGTATFLGERHARIARRRGGARAQVAVARSILVIIWHLLNDRSAQFAGLGPGHYETKIDTNRKARGHIRQLEALGYQVTITQAA